MRKLSKRDNVGISGKRPFAGMSKMRPHADGLDIGAHEIVGCVPEEEENTQEVQTLGTYTSDLAAIVDRSSFIVGKIVRDGRFRGGSASIISLPKQGIPMLG